MDIFSKRDSNFFGTLAPAFVIGLLAVTCLGVFAFIFFYKIVWSSGFNGALFHTCRFDESCKWFVQIGMVTLTACLIFIPIVWFYTIGIGWNRLRRSPHGSDKADEFYATLTIVLVPYFVLGLGMLLELHKLAEAEADSIDAVGAIAGIMILYTLTLLGQFVFVELVQTRRNIEASLREASHWLLTQEKLSDSQDHPNPAPAAPVLKMLEEWANLYNPNAGKSGRPGPESVTTHVRHACVSTLLYTYAEEERQDISGSLKKYRIPHAARPPSLTDPTGKVAFIATNVGYYATFLRNLAPQLGRVASSQKLKPCMAVATYVLPFHWWNWPTETSQKDAIYDPIVRYLEAQQSFAEGGGRIFRRVLLQPNEQEKLPLVPRTDTLITSFLDDKLRFFVDPKQQGLHRLRRSGRGKGREASDDLPGAILGWDYLTGPQKALLARTIYNDGKPPDDDFPVYWIFDYKGEPATCHCADKHMEDECVVPVSKVYNETFHRNGGETELMVVGKEFLLNDMKDDWSSGDTSKPGLGGCSDVMFLGVSSDDVWGRGETRWGCALMATMGLKTETMFLTVVHEKDAVESLWRSVKNAFAAHEPKPIWRTGPAQ